MFLTVISEYLNMNKKYTTLEECKNDFFSLFSKEMLDAVEDLKAKGVIIADAERFYFDQDTNILHHRRTFRNAEEAQTQYFDSELHLKAKETILDTHNELKHGWRIIIRSKREMEWFSL